MTFTTDQLKELTGPLAKSHVKERTQAGRKFSYLESWFVEAEANRIFGFGEWDSETIELRLVAEKPRTIGENKREGWGVSYLAKVRVTVRDDAGNPTIREGWGAGHGIDVDLGLAHESAAKESESDAEKRALKTFGNPFGMALYDRTQANVVNDTAPVQTAVRKPPEPAKPLPAIERSTILEDHMRACTDRKSLKAVWERGAKVCSELQGEHDARLDFLMKLYDELYEKLPKPKTEARPDYDALVFQISSFQASDDLRAWVDDPETLNSINKLPIDWQGSLRKEYAAKLSDLKTEERAIAESESMGIRA